MRREYHSWYSTELERPMELLIFGHDGQPLLVFPTACGRFYEHEDRGMVDVLREKIEAGRLQLFCVDSVDAESWYNRDVEPSRRVARHVQYEKYILREVLPFLRQRNFRQNLAAMGCSFGGYHAVNISLRHPELFTGCLSMSAAFDLRAMGLLDGFYNEDCYFNLPLDYFPNLTDTGILDRLRHNNFVLATGKDDPGWDDNDRLASLLRARNIPVRLDGWGDDSPHDWPWWERMIQVYL
jgi:esterase/lipase superfamily enzyme